MSSPGTVDAAVSMRRPNEEDGVLLHRMVDECGVLELNTCYAYALMAADFADTCVIAEVDGDPAGFVVGYRPPQRPEALFVWQVGVLPAGRGRGLAKRMIGHLAASLADDGVTHVEATVATDNEPSDRLFRGLARDAGADITVGGGFSGAALGGDGHPDEPRYRIGPL